MLLQEHGHRVIPVHPQLQDIEGLAVTKDLSDIKEPVDTLTLYLNPQASSELEAKILALKPKRIIMNPGTENPKLAATAEAAGINVIEACTLVMLKTGQF